LTALGNTAGGASGFALLNSSGYLTVSQGGIGTGTAGVGAFNNITGYTASGATGTTSTNLVFSTSPSLTTPSFSGATYSTSATVSAGTNAQGQGALTSDNNVITTTANNPSGVTLPTATTGRRIIVTNKGTNPISVYPASGGTIDALAANAAITVPVNGVMEFNASSTTQWYSTANLTLSAAATSFSAGTTGFTPSTATTGAVTLAGTLSIANGGTNSTATPTAGGFGYGTGTAYAYTAAGTAGQVVLSGGAGAPTFTTGTLALAGNLTTSGAYATTFTMTGAYTYTMPGATTTLAGLGVAQSFTASQTFNAATSSIYLGANSGNNGVATFYGSTSGSVTVKAAAAAGTSTVFQLPATNGSSGQLLQTDGSGNTSWIAQGGAINVYNVTTTGTWSKATQVPNFSANSRVLIQCWGGGGSGGKATASNTSAGGGGGGAYNERWMTLSDLTATVTATVGNGGAAVSTVANGNTGGTTTFGAYVSAYGGGAGQTSSSNLGGGGGGGQLSAGNNISAGSPGQPLNGNGSYASSACGCAAPPAAGLYSGGGGGGVQSLANHAGGGGGQTVWGGGGGGGAPTGSGAAGAGGTSSYGGNGGAGAYNATAVTGSVPSGGGGGNGGTGSSGAGGPGQIIVTVFPA
jgi:hypothetical protein